MAYNRSNAMSRGTWYQEQKNMLNSLSPTELDQMTDKFDEKFQETALQIKSSYGGVNILRDAQAMMNNEEIMKEYKELLLQPIIQEFCDAAAECNDPTEKYHLESVADQLNTAWDESVSSFLIQESYQTANYLPLTTMDFPVLIKQYIAFLGKDIIPVQNTSSVSIEQRIFTKYLVNNQTGEEFEVPAIYWQKEADGTPTWKKLYNAGKGVRINDKDPILLSDIAAAKNKKYDMFNHLLQDDGTPYPAQGTTGCFEKTLRSRLSYDFNIKYVQYDGKKVRLPGAGIAVDIQNGGTFLNGGVTENMSLPVVDEETNKPTGETVSFSDMLSGRVDFVKGTLTASSCGPITGLYVDGRISNETNLRTIGFREYPEIRRFKIADGCRFQVPFTVEDFAEASASLDFNLYSRFTQQIIINQEMFEDSSILDYLDRQFDEYNGYESDVWNLESYTHTEYVDLDPASISPCFAGDPFEYRSNAVYNAINSAIYELCDRGKLENLGFVITANPKACRLLTPFTSWTVKKTTEIGGVKMNHSFGVMTDSDVPIRVVSSNRIDAYTLIPAYQEGAGEDDMSREYFFNIYAYPLDPHHITNKHLRFARHLTNSPQNAGYQDINSPGGQAALVTTSAQYQTITVQGIQARVICKNTSLVPDVKAGIVKTTTVDGGDTPTPTPPAGGGGDDPKEP